MLGSSRQSFRFAFGFLFAFAIFAAQISANVGVGDMPIVVEHTLTVRTTNGGSVSRNPDSPASNTYRDGMIVTLTAIPDSGWLFRGWLIDASRGWFTPDRNNPLAATVLMTADRHVAAEFVRDTTPTRPHYVTLRAHVAGQGAITKTPLPHDIRGEWGGLYLQGTVVTLTAVADSGWVFSGWNNYANISEYCPHIVNCLPTTNCPPPPPCRPDVGIVPHTITVAMNGDISIGAIFTRPALPPGSVRYMAAQGGNLTFFNQTDQWFGLHKDITLQISANDGRMIEAIPDRGYIFGRWSDGSSNPFRYVRGDISARDGELVAYFIRIAVVDNNLVCGTFRDTVGGGWIFYRKDADATGKVTDYNEYEFGITRAGSNPVDVRLFQNSIRIEPQKTYELNFRARSETPRTVVVTVELGSAAIERWEVLLTASMQEFNKTFAVNPRQALNKSANINDDLEISVSFNSGHEAVNWNLSDVNLVKAQAATNVNHAVKQRPNGAAWSVRQVGGGLQLAGPSDVSARIAFYDMRGRLVRAVSKTAGANQPLMLNSLRIPAGSYFLVVRNAASGHEVHRTRITLTR